MEEKNETRVDNTPNRRKVVITHNGMFHCDEVFAILMLVVYTNEFRGAKIIRSRAKEEWVKADALIDVGCEFNLDRRRFDHHQKNFDQTFSENHHTKLSSAGIVYKYFGKEVIAAVLENLCKERSCRNEWTTEEIDEIFNYVYSELIESIDAIDNGTSQYETAEQPKYRILTHLSCRVAGLNLSWNEKSGQEAEALVMKNFEKAMKMCEEELVRFIDTCAFSYLPAKKLVRTAIANRKQVHISEQIIELPCFCPWTDHFFEMEREVMTHNNYKPILFVIIATNNNEFMVRAVPLTPGSFDLRKPLKEAWRGVPDDEIEELSGIKGLKFVHANGFIGGAKTRHAALQLAIQSLN